MLFFLFQRPIAVLMSFLVIILASVVILWQLPVSLLPAIDVPQIVIKVNMRQASPADVEKSILRPLREGLLTLSNLRNIQSKAHSENGQIELYFEYGTNMSIAYIAVNEKIDQLTNSLPKELSRPQVIRTNTADVPMIRLQIVPKNDKDNFNNFLEISQLADKVIKKRLEALEGMSLVDINGIQQKAIFIMPNTQKMQFLQIDERKIIDIITQNNQQLGSISVKDGQYQYAMQLTTELKNADNIRNIGFALPTTPKIIYLHEIAQITDTIQRPQGLHFYNQKPAIVLTLHKQAQAQMPILIKKINESILQFQKEYPQVEFYLTQNQSNLLEVGISNLQNDLLYGGFFAFFILFLFIGNYKVPFLIGIILPSSLLMSFILFWLFGVSVNIISLAGLALGLGMTIDNAIIIFDNIGKKRKQGLDILTSCVKGTSEMIPPLISSALTTQIVFIPLVFLGGIAGALAYDQAVAVGAILFTSLLVSFFLLPLLYLIIFRNAKTLPKEDNFLYKIFLKIYKKIYFRAFHYRNIVFPFLLIIGILGIGIVFLLEIKGMPTIQKQDILLKINWNEPLNLSENQARTQSLAQALEKYYKLQESDIGIQNFILKIQKSTLQESEMYFFCENTQKKNVLAQKIKNFIAQNFPTITFEIIDAPNAFDLMFKQKNSYIEAHLSNINPLLPISTTIIEEIIIQTKQNFSLIQNGEGTLQETQVRLLPNYSQANAYNITPQLLLEKIQNTLANKNISQIKNFGEVIPIQLEENKQSFQQKFSDAFIVLDSTRKYPLKDLMKYEFFSDYRTLCAGKGGIFHDIHFSDIKESQNFMNFLEKLAKEKNVKVDFLGQYFENQENIKKLIFILFISIALLYLILAIEFESLRMPFIVLFTLPLGFMGSFLLLYLAGESLNIMSAMGLVVMLGIIDNESILKIDTIKRFHKEMPLDEAIHKAGEVCFKPVFMTSLTNILALLPFLFDVGMGADLQRPFVLAIIGGLSIGTFTALFFVPLMYKWLHTTIHF